MNLTKIFGKRMDIADGLRLPVSRHFYYSTFGVRGRYAQGGHMGGTFVCEGFPGTGFFIRNTESHSYLRFVSACRNKNKQNFFTLITGKEPNFEKEYQRIEKAFTTVGDDEMKRTILSKYQNVLSMAKEEEQLQRMVRAIKDKMGHKSNKRYVSVLTHYKSSIASLERDVRSAQLNYEISMTKEQKENWQKLVDAFHLLMESRRLWSVYTEDGAQAYKQVFFDMGVFDYIHVPGDTPVLRDHKDMRYYLLPDGMVAAKSTIDFEFRRWENIEVMFKVVDISTLAVRPQFRSHSKKHKHKHGDHTDALSTLYGTTRAQVVGEIYIPEFDFRFFVNHTGPAEDFAKAIEEYKARKF